MQQQNKSLFSVGQVTGVHGLKGYLKVRSFAESVSIFKPDTKVFVGTSESKGQWLELVKASPHKKGLLVLFKDVDRDIAEDLCGKDIFMSREELPELEDDTFYWEDLIGIKVIDSNLGYLGEIVSVITTGSNDVFVVKGGVREVLVPGLSHVVLSVDLEQNKMIIDLPEGL